MDVNEVYQSVKELHQKITDFAGEVYGSDNYDLLEIIEDETDCILAQIDSIKILLESNFPTVLEVE